MDTLPKSIGWIGLGQMGFPMATQLATKLTPEFTLYINDINVTVLNEFKSKFSSASGPAIEICNSAKQVAENSDIIQTIVPESTHVKAVYLSPVTGVIAAASPSSTTRKLFIDSSTIDPPTSLEINKSITSAFSSSSSTFIDAPVSGGTGGAEAATLTFMVGLDDNKNNSGVETNREIIQICHQLFGLMGTQITFCGAPSLGLAAKICNNYTSGMIALATSESMNLGIKLGLNPRVLSKCMAGSSGGSWVNTHANPCPGVCPNSATSKGYKGGFKVQLMRKDISLAIESARKVGAKLVLSDAGFGAYDAASKDPNCVDRDSRVVYRWLGGKEDVIQDLVE